MTRLPLAFDPEHFVVPDEVPELLKDLILKEKEYVDTQIASNLSANLTIVGVVVTAVVTGIGWVLSAKPPEAAFASTALLGLALFSAIGSMVSSIFNGFAFGYIAYKALYLDRLVRKLLKLQFNPLVTSAFISTMPSRIPINLGALGASTIQQLLTWGVFVWAIVLRAGAGPRTSLVPRAGLVLVGLALVVATAATIATMYALLKTRAATIAEATDLGALLERSKPAA